MKASDLVRRAKEYLNVCTCYSKGWWCQNPTVDEWNRINKMYDNTKYGSLKLIQDGKNPYIADCVCWVKQLLGNGSINNRLSYDQMKNNVTGMGDFNNQKLYDNTVDEKDRLPGMVVCSTGHCGIYIGKNDQWLDCNFDGKGQNGVALRTGIPSGYKVGKIKGVDYSEYEVDEVKDFLDYLYQSWKDARG